MREDHGSEIARFTSQLEALTNELRITKEESLRAVGATQTLALENAALTEQLAQLREKSDIEKLELQKALQQQQQQQQQQV